MSVARRIAYNAVINAVAKIASTVLALVSIGFITRYLGTGGFGKYSVALTFFSFLGAIADLGLYFIATREISRKGADEGKIIGNIFAFRLLISSFVLALAAIGVWFLPYDEDTKIAILLASVGFFFSSSYSVLNGIFQKNLVMDRVAIIEFIGKMLQMIWIICTVIFNLGFFILMGGFVVNMFFNFVGVYWASKRLLVFHIRWDFDYWRSFLKKALPVGISAIVTFLYFKFDTILLSLYQSSEAVGIYSGAYKIIENIIFFPSMVIGLVFPLFSRYIFEEKKKFVFLANKVFKVFSLFVFPLVIGVWFVADRIMLVVGGDQFLPSGDVLKILIFSLGCIFFGQIFNAILLAANRQKNLMYVLALCAAFNLSVNIFVIPRYSYIGAAVVSVFTEAAVVAVGGWLCWKYTRFIPRMRSIKKIALSTLFMGIFLFFFEKSLSFPLLVIFSVLIYSFGIVVLQAIRKQEIAAILLSNKSGQVL